MKNNNTWLFPAFLLLAVFITICSCNKNTPVVTYKIGDTAQGGIIFYLDSTNQHGFACALTKQNDTGMVWSCPDKLDIPNAEDTSLGSGLANTKAILDSCTADYTAAYLCYNLTLNGYSDWFLPSKQELRLMQALLNSRGITEWYWSSTQRWGNRAWMSPGNEVWYYMPYNAKTNVRAVRAF